MWDGLSIGQFFCELNTSYIIGYFDQVMRSRQLNGEALANMEQRIVLKERRRFCFGSDEARGLFDEAEDLRESPCLEHLHSAHSELMTKLFEDEWWHLTNDATEPNPDYLYLERIILAVQQALNQEQLQPAYETHLPQRRIDSDPVDQAVILRVPAHRG